MVIKEVRSNASFSFSFSSYHNLDFSLLFSQCKVTAVAEQSYSYYTGNDGTDKDPQVVKHNISCKLPS